MPTTTIDSGAVPVPADEIKTGLTLLAVMLALNAVTVCGSIYNRLSL